LPALAFSRTLLDPLSEKKRNDGSNKADNQKLELARPRHPFGNRNKAQLVSKVDDELVESPTSSVQVFCRKNPRNSVMTGSMISIRNSGKKLPLNPLFVGVADKQPLNDGKGSFAVKMGELDVKVLAIGTYHGLKKISCKHDLDISFPSRLAEFVREPYTVRVPPAKLTITQWDRNQDSQTFTLAT